MVAKLRSLAGELRALGDPVRAEELDGRVKAARQEAGRSLRDRLDLYGDGGDDDPAGPAPLRGQHPADRPDARAATRSRLAFAVTGTDYRAPVLDRGVRRHPASSGTAADLRDPVGLPRRAPGRGDPRRAAGRTALSPRAALADGTLRDLVRRGAEARYDEGYERGRARPRRRR